MKKTAATELFLNSNPITICEHRQSEIRQSKANVETGKLARPYHWFKVMVGDDSGEVMLFGKPTEPLPALPPYKRGDRLVVRGMFERQNNRISCLASAVELLTD